MAKKSFDELEEQYNVVSEQLDGLFGCEWGGELPALLYDLFEFAKHANEFIEDAKQVDTYDAVQHKRNKEELEKSKLEVIRLSRLSSVGIAVNYMKSVYAIEFDNGNEGISSYGQTTRRQAGSQLRDQVKWFLDTFEVDNE